MSRPHIAARKLSLAVVLFSLGVSVVAAAVLFKNPHGFEIAAALVYIALVANGVFQACLFLLGARVLGAFQILILVAVAVWLLVVQFMGRFEVTISLCLLADAVLLVALWRETLSLSRTPVGEDKK